MICLWEHLRISLLRAFPFFSSSGNTQNMSDLVAAAGLNRSVTPGPIQRNDGSFVTASPGVTSSGRNSVSPHPQAVTPPPNRPPLKINIPSRSVSGQMVRESLKTEQLLVEDGLGLELRDR